MFQLNFTSTCLSARLNDMSFLERLISVGVAGLLCWGCASEPDEALQIFTLDYTFGNGLNGWTAEFTDYPVGKTEEEDTIYRWKTELAPGPGSLKSQNSLLLSCENVNGDIFMFLKRRVDNLRPNTNYSLVFDISLATNATPGQAMILKAGGSPLEPKKVIENGHYTLNIDKGDSFDGGESLFSFGDVGGLSPSSTEFNMITKSNAYSYTPLVVRSNSKGEIWLIVGTDSMYTGTNDVYYSRINVIFSVGQ